MPRRLAGWVAVSIACEYFFFCSADPPFYNGRSGAVFVCASKGGASKGEAGKNQRPLLRTGPNIRLGRGVGAEHAFAMALKVENEGDR